MSAVVLVIPDEDLPEFLRALGAHAHDFGSHTAPSLVAARDQLAALLRQSPPLAATALDDPAPRPHDAPMTYAEAADALNCSKRTIGRLAASGQLERVGRRIARRSIADHADGTR